MPELSVVMSVYNGAATLRETLRSVLQQRGVDLELIVVDDGSTDQTASILEELGRQDSRLRTVRQDHAGLTRALIRGCEAAAAPFIARQDCGDVSLPDRLHLQLEHLRADPSRALVSCQARFVGPNGELLYVVGGAENDDEVRRSLLTDSPEQIRGITHPTAMFPTEVYRRVGGYRPQFYFAQDLDLWIRLAKEGTVSFHPAVLYESRISPDDISRRFRPAQLELTRLTIAIRDATSDAPRDQLLLKASKIRPEEGPRSPWRSAAGYYFIGRCLLKQRDRAARRYFQEAVLRNPLHLKAWLSLAQSLMS